MSLVVAAGGVFRAFVVVLVFVSVGIFLFFLS
jgi:hypothetical protein